MEQLTYPEVAWGQSLVGLIFGRWTVEREGKQEGYMQYYHCKCSCGGQGEVSRGVLLGKISSSCGCLRKELLLTRNTKHGLRHSPEYMVWSSMLTRCYNPKNRRYYCYGARGITVSKEWKEDFETFYKDMGPRPSPQHQIDRKDNDLGYCKDNCHWATRTQNIRNQQSTVRVEYEGKIMPLIEVSEKLGINYHAMYYRYRRGDRGVRLFRPSKCTRANVQLNVIEGENTCL